MNRVVLSKLVALSLILLCGSALAAPRDKAALKKIDEAINTHYLTTDFAKAEAVLLGTVQACGDKCSPNVLARAWMYVGIVRGSGKDDMKGAVEAFRTAVGFDPGIALDEALATPATKDAFKKAKAQGGTAPAAGAGTPSAQELGVEPEPGAGAAGGGPTSTTIQCTPIQREIETRRAVPFSCTTTQPATSGMIFYQEYGGDSWKSIDMQMRKGSLQGMIPCDATSVVGRLKVYVEARDANGNAIDSLGDRGNPINFNVVGSTTQAPPAYPGQDAPERCEDPGTCPPDFPGCKSGKGKKGWGDSCEEHKDCESNFCSSGSCESCTADEECPSGSCVEGACTGGSEEPGGKKEVGAYKKIWVGVHGAYDIALVGGERICNPGAEGWSCYYGGTETEYGPTFANTTTPLYPYQFSGNRVEGGVAPATARILVSFEYALRHNVSVGIRAGYALLGGPDFMPLHAEAGGTLWLRGLDKTGVRPYVHLGVGVGQINAKTSATIYDCATAQTATEIPNTLSGVDDVQYAQCVQGAPVVNPKAIKMDAYAHMGTMFAAPGVGVVYALSRGLGVQLNLDGKVLFPTLGFAFSPSLGMVVGF